MDIKYSKDNLTLGGPANDFRHTLTNLLDSASLKNCWKATGVSFESDEQQENFKFSLSVISGDPEVVFADVDNVISRTKENGWDFECEKVSSGGYIEIVFGDAKYLSDQSKQATVGKSNKTLTDAVQEVMAMNQNSSSAILK